MVLRGTGPNIQALAKSYPFGPHIEEQSRLGQPYCRVKHTN
jgi:hypothetical protein